MKYSIAKDSQIDVLKMIRLLDYSLNFFLNIFLFQFSKCIPILWPKKSIHLDSWRSQVEPILHIEALFYFLHNYNMYISFQTLLPPFCHCRFTLSATYSFLSCNYDYDITSSLLINHWMCVQHDRIYVD